MLVGALSGSHAHARAQPRRGVDVIIAQGTEAGGHTGEISTMVLVPEIVDAVGPDVPVLAAGGIGRGRQMAAAMALGAQGAWTGSIWLTVAESDTEPWVVENLLAAGFTDTVRSRSMTGKPARPAAHRVDRGVGARPTRPSRCRCRCRAFSTRRPRTGSCARSRGAVGLTGRSDRRPDEPGPPRATTSCSRSSTNGSTPASGSAP